MKFALFLNLNLYLYLYCRMSSAGCMDRIESWCVMSISPVLYPTVLVFLFLFLFLYLSSPLLQPKTNIPILKYRSLELNPQSNYSRLGKNERIKRDQ